jgi:hypothetical protein
VSNVKVTVYNEWTFDSNWRLADFHEFMGELTNRIPEEHRGSAIISFDSEYDSGSIHVEVYYSRKQTAEELKAEREEAKRYKAQQEAHERETLAELKAKYENAS